MKQLKEALSEHVYEQFAENIRRAADVAVPTCQKWGASVNRADRSAGGKVVFRDL